MKGCAKLVSQCLQLIAMEGHRHLRCLGMPVMVGVRDVVGTIARISPSMPRVSLHEADMDDMLWNIPKQDIIPSIKTVLRALKECSRGKRDFWFSLHCTGDKPLDRIGKAASKDFRILSQDDVLQ